MATLLVFPVVFLPTGFSLYLLCILFLLLLLLVLLPSALLLVLFLHLLVARLLRFLRFLLGSLGVVIAATLLGGSTFAPVLEAVEGVGVVFCRGGRDRHTSFRAPMVASVQAKG